MIEGFFVDAAHAFASVNSEEQKPEGEMHCTGEGAMEHENTEESFATRGYPLGAGQRDLAGMIARVISLVLVLLLVSFFGQYFWNTYVTKIITIAKPATSVMQILGLFVFLRLMFP